MNHPDLVDSRDCIRATVDALSSALASADPVSEIIIRQLHAEAATLETRITALVLALES